MALPKIKASSGEIQQVLRDSNLNKVATELADQLGITHLIPFDALAQGKVTSKLNFRDALENPFSSDFLNVRQLFDKQAVDVAKILHTIKTAPVDKVKNDLSQLNTTLNQTKNVPLVDFSQMSKEELNNLSNLITNISQRNIELRTMDMQEPELLKLYRGWNSENVDNPIVSLTPYIETADGFADTRLDRYDINPKDIVTDSDIFHMYEEGEVQIPKKKLNAAVRKIIESKGEPDGMLKSQWGPEYADYSEREFPLWTSRYLLEQGRV
jgi:hypothetical protein